MIINKIKYPDVKELTFRLLRKDDFRAFEEAYNETRESFMEFLDIGEFVQEQTSGVMNGYFQKNIRSRELDSFGLFWDGKIVGVGDFYFLKNNPQGCQITFWIRSELQGKGYGQYLLELCTKEAFEVKNFSSVILLIDSKNHRSSKLAMRSGYVFEYYFRHKKSGRLGSSLYGRYVARGESFIFHY
jgi:RimJ/RimL family protein N-acetyltransferase